MKDFKLPLINIYLISQAAINNINNKNGGQ